MTTESDKKKRMKKFIQPAEGIVINPDPIDYAAEDARVKKEAEKALAELIQSSQVSEH